MRVTFRNKEKCDFQNVSQLQRPMQMTTRKLRNPIPRFPLPGNSYTSQKRRIAVLDNEEIY